MNFKSVTIAQTKIIWENPDLNIAKIENLINSTQIGDVLVLPEMFSSGFSINPSKDLAIKNLQTIEWMKFTAHNKDIVICGSLIIFEENQFFNRFFWVQPDGDIFTYNKKHLFTPGKEDEFYKNGNSKTIINYKDLNFCPMICYDLRFPIWTSNRLMKEKTFEYDMLIFVANWPAKRVMHWKQLLIARAIENQSFVVGVNRVGKDDNLIEYNGNSMIIDPQGNIVFEADDKEIIKTINVNIHEMYSWRETFKVSQDWDNFIIS